jgi:hypothetical protein
MARQKHPSLLTTSAPPVACSSTNYRYMIQGKGFLIVGDRLGHLSFAFKKQQGRALHLAENEALIPLMHRCAAGPGSDY